MSRSAHLLGVEGDMLHLPADDVETLAATLKCLLRTPPSFCETGMERLTSSYKPELW